MASRSVTRDNLRTLAQVRAKSRSTARRRPRSFVQTYTPKPKPATLKYIDLNKIFVSYVKVAGPFDEPFLRVSRDEEDGIELMTGQSVEELCEGKGSTVRVEDLTCSSDSDGREEATFLRALADLIDATR